MDSKLTQPHSSGLLQRQSAGGCKCGCKGGCSQQSEEATLHRKFHDEDATSLKVPDSINQVLKSAGQPLDVTTRVSMEPRFRHDFSRVRVHSDTHASDSARAVNAHAYTVGSDIVFAPGKYAPKTESGSALLAHELSHVVQQSAQTNTSASDLVVSSEGDAAEREADAASAQAMQGQKVSGLSQVSSPSLHRQTAGTASTPANTPPAAPPKAATNPPPLQNLQFGSQPMATFDAALDRKECQITLTKKIRFDFLNAPPPNTWGAGYSPWPQGKDTEFQDNFIRAVTDRWSFKYTLAPTSACAAESCKIFKAAVNVIPVNAGEHTVMEVGFFTGDLQPLEMGVTPMGDRARLFNKEMDPRKTEGYTQVPAEHEFGHMLGRSHVNAAACGSNINNPKCYGETPEQMANIMGRGSEVSADDYAPFAFALGQFNSCTWKAQPKAEEGTSALEILGYVGLGVLGAGATAVGIAAAAGAFKSSK
jgi:hypothetical protein